MADLLLLKWCLEELIQALDQEPSTVAARLRAWCCEYPERERLQAISAELAATRAREQHLLELLGLPGGRGDG